MSFHELLQELQLSSKSDIERITLAHTIIEKYHSGILRKSGEPFTHHLYQTARILCKEGFTDSTIICSALLHDILEDTTYSAQQLETQFGAEVASIVQSLTKLTEKEVGFEKYKAENVRKIILATAKDPRVILIKLADRLHNLQTIAIFRKEKQERIAKETLEVYSALAQKVGLYKFRAQLEDVAFHILHPSLYEFIENTIHMTQSDREQNTQELLNCIQTTLKQELPEYEITIYDQRNMPQYVPKQQYVFLCGRPKYYYAIYRKMTESNKTIDQIYDMYGVRIIVKDTAFCYTIHSILCEKFQTNPQRFKDYIREPKPNGYQSLHAQYTIANKSIEVQIRTTAMDQQAENGIASYWRYKGELRDKRFERKISWLKQLLTFKQAHKLPTKIDIFKNELIAVTPKGDTIILDEGATAVDFAFAIHTNVGERIKHAKVNGMVVSLQTPLSSGDIVEIETSEKHTVNENWLSFAHMSSTQNKIRKSLGIVTEPKPKQQLKAETYLILDDLQTSIKKPVKISKCCNPTATQPIVAYFTKDKSLITVHKWDCPNQYALDPKNKVELSVQKKQKYSTTFHMIVKDEPGKFVEVLTRLLEYTVSIQEIKSNESTHAIALAVVCSYISDAQQIATELRKIDGVIDCKIE
jgi:GTP diphosphokinase / guanosine-3',5'-bis(diphosphate) 3'-diphosphatase